MVFDSRRHVHVPPAPTDRHQHHQRCWGPPAIRRFILIFCYFLLAGDCQHLQRAAVTPVRGRRRTVEEGRGSSEACGANTSANVRPVWLEFSAVQLTPALLLLLPCVALSRAWVGGRKGMRGIWREVALPIVYKLYSRWTRNRTFNENVNCNEHTVQHTNKTAVKVEKL